MASRELNILIRAKNLASGAIKGVKSELKGIQKDLKKGIGKAWGNIEKGIAIGAGAAAAGIGYAVKQAADFEAQLNTINTVAKLTGDAFSGELGQIGDSIRALSRETGTATGDLTAAYYDLVSAGIDAADAQDVLTNANTLAIGGLSTTGEAVDLLTTAINAYGGDASQASTFTDQLAQAVNAGKVTVAEISASFATVAPLAASMGVGVDEISAAYANMTAKGTPAAEAMTQMRSAMVALQRKTPAMEKALDDLGISNVQAEVDSRGLVAVWEDLRRYADKTGIPLIELTGRVEGTQFALQNTGDAFDDYNQNLDDVRHSSGEAAAQMGERQKGLSYQLGILKANLNDAAITIGEAVIPSLVKLAKKATAWIQGHQPEIKKFAQDLAKGFEQAVEWASSLDWKAIGNALKTAADAGKAILDAFLSMPSWVQGAIASGWGLNKLTGGAFGSIIGSLASGLIKGVLGINAGVVNVNAGVVNGAGGMPGGGGGGFLPTGFKGWASLVGIAIADAFLIKTAFDEFGKQTANVTVAADFERSVVADRTRRAGGVDDLRQLREDIAGSIDNHGNVLENALGNIFVDPELKRQVADLDAQIQAQTLALVREDRDMTRHVDAGASATRKEMQDIRAAVAAQARTQEYLRADAASSDAAMLGNLSAQTQQLRALNAKPFSANVTVNTTNNFSAAIRISATSIASSLYRRQYTSISSYRGGVSQY